MSEIRFDQQRLEDISALFVEELYDEDDGILARRYLSEERGIEPSSLRSYEIGFCPPWVKYPHQGKLSVEGHLWYMRGRLIVTVRDVWGRILGFNGRRVDGCEEELEDCLRSQYGNDMGMDMASEWSKRKWVNESFSKSDHVYNLDRRRRDILKIGSAVIVEGCMDVIVMDAHGFHNVVSTLGTAVSDIQISLMRRYTNHLTLCFDPDIAGSKNTIRLMKNARDNGALSSTIIRLKDGKDPDEMVLDPRERDLFEWAVKNAPDPARGGRTIDLANESSRMSIRLLMKQEESK